MIEQIQQKLGVTPLPLQLAMGRSSEFAGVIDLIEMQAVYFDGEQGEDIRREAIPRNLRMRPPKGHGSHAGNVVALQRRVDGRALLEETAVSNDEIRKIIREATLSQELTPVLMGTAVRNKGVQELLDAILWYLPNPTDRKIEAIDLSAKPQEVAPAETEDADDSAKELDLKSLAANGVRKPN